MSGKSDAPGKSKAQVKSQANALAKSGAKEKKNGKAKPPTDVALLHGPTEDGQGARVLRWKDGELSAGEVRPVKEGQALGDSELVRLKPMAGEGPLCEVESLHGGDQATTASAPEGASGASGASERNGGPARVSNPSYRKNYDQIFDRPTRKRDPKNYSLN